jgi:hypothetical protein
MTAISPSSDFQVSYSQRKYGDHSMKNLAESAGDSISSSRKAFAGLLWRAFPSPSEHELAVKAGKVLNVSPRQVKNWLRCDNSAAVHYFFAVAAIAGAEVVFREHAGQP